MPITLNHSNINVQYETGKNYNIETVKSDLFLRNENVDTVIRNNIQTAPVTPTTFVDSSGNVYAVEAYTYSGTANTADYTRVFSKNTTCDILIVGGGGGGSHNHGGGGGAGGVVFVKSVNFNSGSYTIKVGAGGAKGTRSTTNFGGLKGNDSKIILNNVDILNAEGGGGGGQGNAVGSIGNGGSGGGGDGYRDGLAPVYNNGIVGTGSIKDYNGTTGVLYGNNGGTYYLATSGTYLNKAGAGGGGGGAGQVGSNATKVNVGGNGGNGISSATINGITYNFVDMFGTTYGTNNDNNNTTRYFGGGGGGSIWGDPTTTLAPTADIGDFAINGSGGKGGGGAGALTAMTTGSNGTANTGGGGGGGSYSSTVELVDGGNGGSGIVIIRYLLGTILTTNLLTSEPIVTAPTFTESVRTFLHSGGTDNQTTHNITVGQNTICDILIVGGGGGGGKFGGGGGSGAILFANNLLLSAGYYTVKVGKGGAGASGESANGTDGIDTSILINAIEYIAKGGGGGGSRQPSTSSYAGRSGNNGGSGGGGSSSDTTETYGGSSTKNTYTFWESYGNGGGKGKAGASPWVSGGGGGAGSVGSNWSNTKGGNGGSGINFSSYFGTTVGHNGWFGGGGGGNFYNPTIAGDYGYGNGGNGLFGGGGNGANETTVEISATDGLPNTGGGGGGGKWDGAGVNGGAGGSGIVIIKFKSITNAAVSEGTPATTHKSLNFAYDLTKYTEYQAQLKTGVGGWRIVRFLPPNLGRWYQGDYINTSTFTIPIIGTPYNYTNEWAVPFGTFDEMFFGTFNMNYWLQCLKTSVLESYSDIARPVIKSSERNYSHSVKWYNRTSSTVDPLISINDYSATPNLMVYVDNNHTGSLELISIGGGMCVLVRDSTANTSISDPNLYSLNFPVPTLTDINNNSNIVLRGAYDISLSTSNSLIIPKANQYIPHPTTFSTSNIFLRYHLLNPVLDPIGAQWTYSSNNTNVYHMGCVGIGTTSPEYHLDVRGNIYSSSGGYTQSGLTTWSITSDRRIKENIVKASYEKCLENVKNIELYNFNFKDNYVNTNDRRQLGFIAQEVQQVYPKAVEVGKMILNLEEKIDDLLTLNTTQIDYTLYGAVKGLIHKMENIKIKMEQIKATSNITMLA